MAGSFGAVSKIRRKSDGQILVWKELNYGKMNEKEKAQIVAEVNILRELSHQNIVKYHDRFIDKKNQIIYIIMEYCAGGDLQQIIKRCIKNQEQISEDFIWKIFAQIVSGLHYCHRRTDLNPINNGKNTGESELAGPQKILHRDLKPGNIFLDANNDAKVGDFGLARVMNCDSQFAQTHVGTPYYMSPEQINEQRYNEKSDIWSLGCIIYEMAALRPPFKANSHLSLAIKIKAGKYDRIPQIYSDELWETIQWMISLNQEKRASIEDLLSVPRMKQILQDSGSKALRSSTESDKLKQRLKVKEAQLNEKVAELIAKESMLNQREADLRNFERDQELRLQQRSQELNEREKLLNEILKLYELPQTTSDLQKYLESCTQSSGVGSGNLGSTGFKTSSKLSFSPQTVDHQKRVPRLPNTQQSSQSTSQVQQILKNNRSDPNLTKETRQILDESGSPIEYLKRFKIAKRDEQQLHDSLLQESVLADTFRQTVFNPHTHQQSRNTQQGTKTLPNQSQQPVLNCEEQQKIKQNFEGIGQLLQILKSNDESQQLRTYDSRQQPQSLTSRGTNISSVMSGHQRQGSSGHNIALLPPKQPGEKKPQLPKTTTLKQASLSKSKLKASSSTKKLSTTRGSSASLEASGNLTSRLLRAERTIIPSDQKQKQFLTQFINSSADSNKTNEGQALQSEPQELASLLRRLQPSSTKNLHAPEKANAFKFITGQQRSGSTLRS